MATLLLILALLADPAANDPAKRKLPSATKLVDEALEVCRETDDLFTAPSLMAALLDCDRDEEAFRIAFDAQGEIDRSVRLAVYSSLVAERRGMSSDAGTWLKDESSDVQIAVHAAIAQELADLGKPADAELHYDRLTDERGARLWKARTAVALTEAYIKAEDREGARRIVRLGLDAGAGFAMSFVISDDFDPLAEAAVELGERESLQKVLEASEVTAKKAATPDVYTARVLSRVGRWWAGLGNGPKSERAFADSSRITRALEAAITQREGAAEQKRARGFAQDAYIELAANTRLAGKADQADAWRGEFLRLTQNQQPDGVVDEFALVKAVQTCARVNDREEVQALIAMIDDPYWRVEAQLDAAGILLDIGEAEAVRPFLAAAAAELNRAGD